LRKLLAKKLGFRTLFDVVPLDAALVRGSHGLGRAQAEECPVFIGSGPAPAAGAMHQTAVHELVLQALGLV
jgi:hypothetical protein